MKFPHAVLRPPVGFAPKFILPVAILMLASCSSPPPVAWNSKTSFTPATYESNQEIGGEVVTEAVLTTATVISVDQAKRLVVLKRADGSSVTYKALPGALGFDTVQAGDEVKVSVAEELAVFLGRNSVPAGTGADTAKLRVRLPDGTQTAVADVGTLVYTGVITAINDWDDTVTLQLHGGQTKTVKVSEFVNLADVSVGDTVSVRASQAAVLMLEKL